MMRRSFAIIKATALEILSEPLVFLVTVSAMALSVVAPAMHYHEFGEPSRMARDAGVSALLIGGIVIAAFGGVRSVRREIESQTALSALALSVSRRRFFLSKTVGVVLAYLFFVITVGAVSLAVVRGSVIGGEIAAREATMTRMYGPVFACAVAAFVVPFLYGGAVNRYFGRRFTLNANLCAFVASIVSAGVWFDGGVYLRVLPVYVLAAVPALVLLCASAAFSARFGFNVATAAAFLVFAAFVPAVGNYCLTDVLSAGGNVGWRYYLLAMAAAVPPVSALLYVGCCLFEGAE